MNKLDAAIDYAEKVETIKRGLLLAAGLTIGHSYLPYLTERAQEIGSLIMGGVDDPGLLLGEPPEGVDIEKLGLGKWGKVDQGSDLELWLIPAWLAFYISPQTVVHDTLGRHATYDHVISTWKRLDDYPEDKTPLLGYLPLGFLRPAPDTKNFLEG